MLKRLAAVAVGSVLDECFGEPPAKVHPVVWFGNVMSAVEKVVWSDRRFNGVIYTGVGVCVGTIFGKAVGSTAVMTALCVAGRELRRVAADIADSNTIDADGEEVFDVISAREKLPQLVGRDPSQLDITEISSAVIESVAENSVDAIIAPIFWAAIAGPGGVGAYRAINTMDAMVGHRSQRYEKFGWASARLDDIANWIPARIFAGLVLLQHRHKARYILATIRRDGPKHPSPNAGVAESAVAAAIGIELGGQLRYGSRVENRPLLGDGPRPQPADITKAIQISSRAQGFI